MPNYYDAHCHLNAEKLFANRTHYLQDFITQGGKGLVNVGANDDYNTKAIRIADHGSSLFPDFFVKSSIGLHPGDLSSILGSPEKEIEGLKKLYHQHSSLIVAIGECGLDYHYPDSGGDPSLQKKIFKLQCALAQELQLPLVIHSRDAFADTIEILSQYPQLKIYFHCRSYGPQEIQVVQQLFKNFYIGFAGNVSYPKADLIRESLHITPIKHLLIETDAPYLAPQEVRGTTNSPQNIIKIGLFISKILELSEQELREQVKENFFHLYT